MTRPYALAIIALGSAGLGSSACVTKSDIQQIQTDIALSKAELGRRDSVRAAQLNDVLRMQQTLYDSLMSTNRSVSRLRGDLSNDLYNIQQQLSEIQELTGQSQRRLSEIRTQLEAREAQIQATPAPADTATPIAGGTASADQMYKESLDQLNAGRKGTARAGFQEMLRLYPASERAPDALYFLGHSFVSEAPDSAAFYYQQVVDRYATTSQAASSLYNLGLLADRDNNRTKAKELYGRVVKEYPKSPEAALAGDKLKAPRP